MMERNKILQRNLEIFTANEKVNTRYLESLFNHTNPLAISSLLDETNLSESLKRFHPLNLSYRLSYK